MASFFSLIQRNWTAFHPVESAKKEGALRIGLLGASNIAPIAVIIPAKSHPEVIIAAVAARDRKKAEVYARKHGIPVVFDSYQELIDDPSIDAIYIPLPNGLHYEWALKSLQAKKHVLLEKPSVSNATEAHSLFTHPLFSSPTAPVLLEAFHPLFHPAIQFFLREVRSGGEVEYAISRFSFPAYVFPKSDIRFQYDVSGGTLMDLTYMPFFLRLIFGEEPKECLEANPRIMPLPYDQKCDQAMHAKWRWGNGGVGEISADLAGTYFGWLPKLTVPMARVVLHERVVGGDEGVRIGEGEEYVLKKTITLWNTLGPLFWHRIDIVHSHCIRVISSKKVVRKWEEKESKKAYSWSDIHGGEEGGFNGVKGFEGKNLKGDPSWSTYRYQLEAFVDRVKGREGSGVWIEGVDSVRQMEMIDQAYLKAGLPLRPTSSYLEGGAG